MDRDRRHEGQGGQPARPAPSVPGVEAEALVLRRLLGDPAGSFEGTVSNDAGGNRFGIVLHD